MRATLYDTLGVIILYVTHRCNLGCPYCFSTFHHPDALVDFEDTPGSIDNLIAFINRVQGKDTFTLVFFGGEPTLRWDTCLRIYDACKTRCNKKIDFRLQTNGTRLSEIVDDLAPRADIHVCVSFDSSAKNHNKYRSFRDGSPSWSVIYEGIKNTVHRCGSDRLSVVYTYHPSTASSLGSVVSELFNLGIRRVRTSIIKEDGVTPEQMSSLINSYKQIVDYLVHHTDCEYQNFGLFTLSEPDKLREFICNVNGGINTSACRAGQYKVWVTGDGLIYPCTTLIEPQYIMGSIHSGELTRVASLTVTQLSSPQCNECNMRPGCQFCLYRSVIESGTLMHCSSLMKAYSEIKMISVKYLIERCREAGLV